MAEGTITCPSGLSGRVRSIKVADLAVFSERRLLRQRGPAMEAALLKRVWLETHDRGPYVFEGENPPWKNDILIGDMMYVLLEVRRLSYGSDYPFDRTCEHCGELIKWEMDLGDLKIQLLSDEARSQFMEKNEFATTAPDGEKVMFRLPTGKTQQLMDRLVEEHGRAGVAAPHILLAARITKWGDLTSVLKIIEALGELNYREFKKLQKRLEEPDCGVDTEINIDCDKCDKKEQATTVPFGGDFFMPD